MLLVCRTVSWCLLLLLGSSFGAPLTEEQNATAATTAISGQVGDEARTTVATIANATLPTTTVGAAAAEPAVVVDEATTAAIVENKEETAAGSATTSTNSQVGVENATAELTTAAAVASTTVADEGTTAAAAASTTVADEGTTASATVIENGEETAAATITEAAAAATTEAAATATSSSTSTTTMTTTTTTTTEKDLSPVILTRHQSVQNFVVGEPFVLECLARSDGAAAAAVEYSWNKNGRRLDVRGARNIFRESSTDNGNILILGQKSDEGTYQCVAENSFGKAYSQSSLVTMRGSNSSQRSRPRKLHHPEAAGSSDDVLGRRPVSEVVAENVPDFVGSRQSKQKDVDDDVFVVYSQT